MQSEKAMWLKRMDLKMLDSFYIKPYFYASSASYTPISSRLMQWSASPVTSDQY